MQRISVISLLYFVTYLEIFIAESSCCKRKKNMNLTSLEESHYFLMKEVMIQDTFKPRKCLYIYFSHLTAKCSNWQYPSEFVSIWRGDLQIIYPFLVFKEKTVHTQGENCNKLKLFPWGLWKGFVSAAPALVNYLIQILYFDNHAA